MKSSSNQNDPSTNEMRGLSQESQSRLEQFFSAMLEEMYWGEQCLVNVLQTMSESAESVPLKEAFENHREDTRRQVGRLEQAFQLLGKEPHAQPCPGLQGLFDEGWKVIDETPAGSAARDMALIIAAQKVEHYEIACYGSMRTLARTMGENDLAALMDATLAEENEADTLLTNVAEQGINFKASKEPAMEAEPA